MSPGAAAGGRKRKAGRAGTQPRPPPPAGKPAKKTGAAAAARAAAKDPPATTPFQASQAVSSRALLAEGKALEAEGKADAAGKQYARACQQAEGAVEAEALLKLGALARARATDADDLEEYEGMIQAAVEAGGGGKFGEEAMKALCFFLHQEGRHQEADFYLKEIGFTYRLSTHVLHYQLPAEKKGKQRQPPGARELLAAVDGAVPPDLLAYMLKVFCPAAPFWSEHRYHDPCTGYFSYLHKLTPKPRNGLEQVIRHLYDVAVEQFPAVKEAKFAEWWAHCRPHPSGHQLHFDSDNEGEGGEPRHPIVSTVMYLAEGGVGGPTLVTDQRRGGTLAGQGWVAAPKLGRVVIFDGSVLHGVIPGRGPCQDPAARRVTFMCAFWRDIAHQPAPEDGRPGSSRPFPPEDSKGGGGVGGRGGGGEYTWHKPLLPLVKGGFSKGARSMAAPAPVASVWEPVEGAGGAEDVGELTSRGEVPAYDTCFQGF